MSDATFAELISPADATVARTSETVLPYNLIYNGTNFDLQREVPAADAQGVTGLTAAAAMVFNGTNWDRARSGGVTGMQGVSGDTANDAVDAGNPVKIGGHAISGNGGITAVSGNDRVDAWFGLGGQQVVSVGIATTASDGAS